MSDEVIEGWWDRPDREEVRRRGLRWLGGLRWWAAAGAMAGVLLSIAVSWAFVSTPAIVGGLLGMVVINSVLLFRVKGDASVGRNELLLHASVDILMLTWLLAWAGGVRNPLCMAYAFHVVLGALLNGRRGVLYAVVVSVMCMAGLWAMELTLVLPTAPLHDPPALLWALSVLLLMVGLAYLSLVSAERATGERLKAKDKENDAEQALGLLLEMLKALRVGVVVQDKGGRTVLQSEGAVRHGAADAAIERARAILDHAPDDAVSSAVAGVSDDDDDAADEDRSGGGDAARGDGKNDAAVAPPGAAPLAARRVSERFSVTEGDAERVIELIGLKPSHPRVAHAFLSVDRTESLLVEQRHVMLERLATLGRAMQGVAHELNTPLTTMQTLAKDLRAALADTALPPAVRDDVEESLALIIEETRRCRSLTQSLLSTANESNRKRGLSAPLLAVAERAVRMVGSDADAVTIDKGVGDVGDVDADRVLQILMNLVQNALAATADLEGESDRVSITATNVDNAVTVVVRDRGPGLPALVTERLFEPFVTTKAEGTGLGLYTSQQLARELGGSLDVRNHTQGGTEAILRLGRQEPRSAP
jgi:signal transduction histidine kinase